MLLIYVDSESEHTGGEANVELKVPDIPAYLQRTVVISHDNTSNIVKAVSDCSVPNIRCLAHTLNLSVQKFVKSLNEQTCHLRDIVKHIQRSPAA